MGDSIAFDRLRQCTPQWASAPYHVLSFLSRFAYIDRRTCPGMSGHVLGVLRIAASRVWIWTPI